MQKWGSDPFAGLLALLAFLAVSALGACAGQSTSPLATPSSDARSLSPGQRSNSGYLVAEQGLPSDTAKIVRRPKP